MVIIITVIIIIFIFVFIIIIIIISIIFIFYFYSYHMEMQAYREDLEELPNNGWSVLGLGRALQGRAQQQPDLAAEAEQLLSEQFPAVWTSADVSLTSSCLAFSGM